MLAPAQILIGDLRGLMNSVAPIWDGNETWLALLAGYALLGATWLVIKTEGELQLTWRFWCR